MIIIDRSPFSPRIHTHVPRTIHLNAKINKTTEEIEKPSPSNQNKDVMEEPASSSNEIRKPYEEIVQPEIIELRSSDDENEGLEDYKRWEEEEKSRWSSGEGRE